MPGRIPKTFIDDLLLRVDIVDVIDARVPLKKAGKDHKACCPFHEEKTPSFTVSQTKQFYHCFGCGKNGSAIGFLMEYDHMSFPEAVSELANRAGLTVPTEAGLPIPQSASTTLLDLLNEAARFYRNQLRSHPSAHKAVDYLKSRGLSGEVAQSFGVGFAPEGWDNLTRALGEDEPTRNQLVAAGLATKKDGGGYYDRLRNRIVFPIHDHRGRIVGFGGRVIDPNDEPKYLNSPETSLFHKGRELYGLYRARDAIKRQNRVLVVEGYMDVMALAQHGVDFAVATLGTATTRDHLERLFRFVPEVVYCFDGDRAGREAAWKALDVTLPLLLDGHQASFLFLPDGEDPDTLVRKEGGEYFLKLISTATPLPEFFFQSLAKQLDLSRSDSRARLAELAKPYLSKVPSGVLKETMLDRLNLSPVAREKLSELAKAANTLSSGGSMARAATGGLKSPPKSVRMALALLVQHPELNAQFTEEFADADQPGMELLHAVARVLRQRPGLNTAALLEHFRESEHAPVLARLAVWDHPAMVQDVAAEFTGVLNQLRKAKAHTRTDRLLQKQRLHGLTMEERAELARLLADKNSARVR